MSITRAILCAFLAAPLCGCLHGEPTAKTAEGGKERLNIRELTKAETAIVQEGLRRSLKDPESARFGQMMAGVDAKGGTTVCLLVNAKNSYGGYTGDKPFIGTIAGQPPKQTFIVAAGANHSRFRDEATFEFCDSIGLRLG